PFFCVELLVFLEESPRFRRSLGLLESLVDQCQAVVNLSKGGRHSPRSLQVVASSPVIVQSHAIHRHVVKGCEIMRICLDGLLKPALSRLVVNLVGRNEAKVVESLRAGCIKLERTM